MSRVAVIGEPLRVQGFALAGALACEAGDRDEALAAWESLPPDVAVLIVTPGAAVWLGDKLSQRPGLLSAVMPG
jgi:vacuolar-type H+-ATPase subunit F/Vma7